MTILFYNISKVSKFANKLKCFCKLCSKSKKLFCHLRSYTAIDNNFKKNLLSNNSAKKLIKCDLLFRPILSCAVLGKVPHNT